MNNAVWDNTKIFKDFFDPKIEQELTDILKVKDVIQSKISSLDLNYNKEMMTLAQEISSIELDVSIQIQSIATFANMAISVDSLNIEAKQLLSKVSKLSADLNKALKPLHLFLLRAPEDFIQNFLDHPRVKEIAFALKHERGQNDFLLTPHEEVLITGLATDGIHAWGKLYKEIAGKLQVCIDDKKIGIAQAQGMLKQSDRSLREKSYRGINSAWEVHEDAAASSLNAINGWRWEVNRARSKKRELHYLDHSCHQSRITRVTLNTLMDVAYEQRKVGHFALDYMAKEIGTQKIAPWDLLAAMPEKGESSNISFNDAIEIIKDAFRGMDPDMADFVEIMVKNNWIDAQPTPNRSPGAYCTGVSKFREPRVFMTYLGSMNDILTLAHELGHAYHNWVMRDLSLSESRYSMTLAETASIFAETLVKDHLLKNAKNELDKKKILWQECESASSLLINIPARFEFEKNLVELRKDREVSAKDLKDLMIKAQTKWYANALSENDEMFWASKLHFHMSGLGFYNYPYLFGYLFSLGIYAKRDSYGANFTNIYTNLLRDTGTMTAEEVVSKHLGEDIEKADFWNNSIKIVADSIGFKL